MFRSRVAILPEPPSCGDFVLWQGDNEWAFDAHALHAGRTSAVAYVAFFSDIEHGVLPVRSGHRVTLTYNSYDGLPEDARSLSVHAPQYASRAPVLDDPLYLPQGGTLGFGLRHR